MLNLAPRSHLAELLGPSLQLPVKLFVFVSETPFLARGLSSSEQYVADLKHASHRYLKDVIMLFHNARISIKFDKWHSVQSDLSVAMVGPFFECVCIGAHAACNTEARAWKEIGKNSCEGTMWRGMQSSCARMHRWTVKSIDMLEGGEVFVYGALELRTYSYIVVILVGEMQNSFVLTCSWGPKLVRWKSHSQTWLQTWLPQLFILKRFHGPPLTMGQARKAAMA